LAVAGEIEKMATCCQESDGESKGQINAESPRLLTLSSIFTLVRLS